MNRLTHETESRFEAGDIFACWGVDFVSRLISVQTSSVVGPVRFGPSHVAIACQSTAALSPDPFVWFESTTMTSRLCLAANRAVSGVQVHPIEDRIRDYTERGGTVWQYRLMPIDLLTTNEAFHLWQMLSEMLGGDEQQAIGYDTRGAILSGTRVLKRFLFSEQQLESVFCSELIAAVLMRLNRMNRRDPGWYNPARLIRTLVRSGTYERIATFEPHGHVRGVTQLDRGGKK
jgi:hypothetical protein